MEKDTLVSWLIYVCSATCMVITFRTHQNNTVYMENMPSFITVLVRRSPGGGFHDCARCPQYMPFHWEDVDSRFSCSVSEAARNCYGHKVCCHPITELHGGSFPRVGRREVVGRLPSAIRFLRRYVAPPGGLSRLRRKEEEQQDED